MEAARLNGSSILKYQVNLLDKTGSEVIADTQNLLLEGNVTCDHLKSIVSSLKPSIQTDLLAFFINSQLIKSSIHDSAQLLGLTGEDTLIIEYYMSSSMPRKKNVYSNKDWVSSICFSAYNDRILAGLYNGNINIWTFDGKIENQFEFSDSGIRKLMLLQQNSTENSSYFVSCHENCEIKLLKQNLESQILQEEASIVSHDLSVVDIDQLPDTSLILTSSDDKTSRLHRIELTEHSKFPIVELSVYTLHSLSVTGSKFLNENSFVTSSMDQTIMLVDIESSDRPVSSFNLPAPVFSLCRFPNSENCVIAGLFNNMIHTIDLRAKDKLMSQIFKSHTNVISCLASDPQSPDYHFFSASYDKSVKLWDIRSSNIPLHDFIDHAGRVLSLATNNHLVASGGTDGNLNFYNRLNEPLK